MEHPTTADMVSKEWLEKIMSKAEGTPVFCSSYDVHPGANVGENFMCDLWKVKVHLQDGNCVSVILKFSPSDKDKMSIFKEVGMFEKEAQLYTQLLQDLREFQISQCGKVMVELAVPRCIFAGSNSDGSGIIVLEDLEPMGFKLADKDQGISLEQALLLFKELATFHGLSQALKVWLGGESEMLRKYPWVLDDVCQHESIRGFLNSSFEEVIKLLRTVPDQQRAIARLNEFAQKKCIADRAAEFNKAKEPLSVICHGDLWLHNVMFSPNDVRIIDFQTCGFSRNTIDIVNFLFSSTSRSFREKYVNELLKCYHQQLLHVVHMLKVPFSEQDFPFDALLRSYKESLGYGFVVSGVQIPMLMETAPKEVMMARLLEVVEEMMENGFF